MYSYIKKRFWWFYLLLMVILLMLLSKNLEAQDLPDESLNYGVYKNGKEIRIGEEPIIFIYGNEPFGFKDGGFQAITLTGDTIYIQIKRKQK